MEQHNISFWLCDTQIWWNSKYFLTLFVKHILFQNDNTELNPIFYDRLWHCHGIWEIFKMWQVLYNRKISTGCWGLSSVHSFRKKKLKKQQILVFVTTNTRICKWFRDFNDICWHFHLCSLWIAASVISVSSRVTQWLPAPWSSYVSGPLFFLGKSKSSLTWHNFIFTHSVPEFGLCLLDVIQLFYFLCKILSFF